MFKKTPQLQTKLSLDSIAISLFALSSGTMRSCRESTSPWVYLAKQLDPPSVATLHCPQCSCTELISATSYTMPLSQLSSSLSNTASIHDMLKTPGHRSGQAQNDGFLHSQEEHSHNIGEAEAESRGQANLGYL